MKLTTIFLVGFLILFGLQNISALSITVHVPEKYTEVNAGDRFYFDLAVKYPENPTRIDLRLNYEVRNKGGELIAQAKTLKAVETQASFIDYIMIPENTGNGFYTIDILISDYGELSQKVGTSFYVTSKKSDKITLYFFILLGSIFFLGILIVLVSIKRTSK